MTPEHEGTSAAWIKELRERLHAVENHQSRLEGEMEGDRRVAAERHLQVERTTTEIKDALAGLARAVDKQGDTVTKVGHGQDSILQTMEAERQTRIATAEALALAEKQRRDKRDDPWVTPRNALGLVAVALGVLAYVGAIPHPA